LHPVDFVQICKGRYVSRHKLFLFFRSLISPSLLLDTDYFQTPASLLYQLPMAPREVYVIGVGKVLSEEALFWNALEYQILTTEGGALIDPGSIGTPSQAELNAWLARQLITPIKGTRNFK
jgi:hypothetical protein